MPGKGTVFALYGAPFSLIGTNENINNGPSQGALLDSDRGNVCISPRQGFTQGDNVTLNDFCDSFTSTGCSTYSYDMCQSVQADNGVVNCSPLNTAGDETVSICTGVSMLCSTAAEDSARTTLDQSSSDGVIVDSNIKAECYYPRFNSDNQKIMVAGAYLDKDLSSDDEAKFFKSCNAMGGTCTSSTNEETGLCGAVWYGQGKGAVKFNDGACNIYEDEKCVKKSDILHNHLALGCTGYTNKNVL